MFFQRKLKNIIQNCIMDTIKAHEYYFLNLINESLTAEKIIHITQTNYSCWGDPLKLHISNTASMVNTQFNTSSGDIYIGEYTFTGHSVSIITGTHDYTKCLRERQISVPAYGNDIWIGNGVWLGSNSVVLGPNWIGDNAIIAAGAIVLPNTNVPANTMYGGVPAKKLKTIVIEGGTDSYKNG